MLAVEPASPADDGADELLRSFRSDLFAFLPIPVSDKGSEVSGAQSLGCLQFHILGEELLKTCQHEELPFHFLSGCVFLAL
jgi:hypothetical protein